MTVTPAAYTCNGCGKPLVGSPGYPRNDMLVLSVGHKPTPRSDFEYAVMQYPPLDGDKHFHGEACLRLWSDRRRDFEQAYKADQDRRTKNRMISPPDERTPVRPADPPEETT